MKKTGMTPIVEEADLGAGSVLGVVPVNTVLVKYRDGNTGRDEVKLAVVIPDGEIYFFERVAVNLRPAQRWLKRGVIKALSATKTPTEG